MKKRMMAASLFALAIVGLPFSALADDAGKELYLENCASCHGASGVGDGEMAEFMSVKVPDLTGLSKANEGTFPTLKMVHVIDGRSGVRLRGHGTEMPIWGNLFTDEGGMAGDYSSVIAARGRVLSVVYYLESIQK